MCVCVCVCMCEVFKPFELQKITAGIGRPVSLIRLLAGYRRLSHDHVETVTSMQEKQAKIQRYCVIDNRLQVDRKWGACCSAARFKIRQDLIR